MRQHIVIYRNKDSIIQFKVLYDFFLNFIYVS